jgi:hypothetical protein
MLNVACSSSVGSSSSQYQVSGSPMQRADQRDIRPYYRGADHDRPLGEGEYENAGD